MPSPAGRDEPSQFAHPVMQVQYRLWLRTRQAATGPQNWADIEFPASGKAQVSGLYEHAHMPHSGLLRRCTLARPAFGRTWAGRAGRAAGRLS